ncbi:MAG: hypothetical protein U1F39_05465 [Steroidobacteraceae bacterium]
MNRAVRLVVMAGTLAMAACAKKPGPTPTPAEGRGSTSDIPTGQANVEDPKTQTNTGRPDSQADLKPGTDGNR